MQGANLCCSFDGLVYTTIYMVGGDRGPTNETFGCNPVFYLHLEEKAENTEMRKMFLGVLAQAPGEIQNGSHYKRCVNTQFGYCSCNPASTYSL